MTDTSNTDQEALPNLGERLEGLIAHAQPRTVLAVGRLSGDLLGDTPGVTHPEIGSALATVEASGVFDMAVLAGDLAPLGPEASKRLLSRLRDLHARWVIVAVPGDAAPQGWTRRDMVGMGFSLLGTATCAGTLYHVYEFDIATYKPTPDWLNSKYWANPEMWDKYRW